MGGNSGESYRLTSPQGSMYDLASWSRFEEGPDFGDSWMAARYAENPAADGGQFAYESIGVRTMTFPLLVASTNPGGGPGSPDLLETESLLRMAARPGGYIDVQLANVATADAIRFDVLGGRWKPDYHMRHQAISLRLGTLELDVQPFGYLPTEILLASVASMAIPGKLTVPGGSVLGDVPGLGNLYIRLPIDSPTQYAGGTWRSDFLGWSLAGRPSAAAFWGAGSLTAGLGFSAASIAGDKFAPGSQCVQIVPSQNLATWAIGAYISISDVEPAYRGRFRAFTWMKFGPSQPLPWYVSADVANNINRALASAAPVATLPPDVASGSPGAYGAQASPAYRLLDLGELTIPELGSGATTNPHVRLWITPATSNVGIASTTITFGGLYLHPLQGAAGFFPRGLIVPTTNAVGVALAKPYIRVNAIRSEAVIDDGDTIHSDLGAYYHGGQPLIGPSAVRLDLIMGERPMYVAATGPIIRGFAERNDGTSVSLAYRPRFSFVRGF